MQQHWPWLVGLEKRNLNLVQVSEGTTTWKFGLVIQEARYGESHYVYICSSFEVNVTVMYTYIFAILTVCTGKAYYYIWLKSLLTASHKRFTVLWKGNCKFNYTAVRTSNNLYSPESESLVNRNKSIYNLFTNTCTVWLFEQTSGLAYGYLFNRRKRMFRESGGLIDSSTSVGTEIDY